jgi:hypothetical protein
MKYLEKIITKELLKKIITKETENLTEGFSFHIDEDYIVFRDVGETLFDYNIYKFAFKCKEWALSKGYILSSNNYSNGGCCQVIQENGEECPECGECTTFEFIHSFTEIEAIIKATNSISLKEGS